MLGRLIHLRRGTRGSPVIGRRRMRPVGRRLTLALGLLSATVIAMMGKYLNGYGEPAMTRQVPRGWSDWHVAGNAYPEFNYDVNENGAVVHYGPPPPAGNAANYLTDVLAARASAFIDRAAAAHRPFMMEVATFAPHRPYTPAPRNSRDFSGLRAPRDSSFNVPTPIRRTGSPGARDSRVPRWPRSTASTGCERSRWRRWIACSPWSRRD
jgi:Sulfatase